MGTRFYAFMESDNDAQVEISHYDCSSYVRMYALEDFCKKVLHNAGDRADQIIAERNLNKSYLDQEALEYCFLNRNSEQFKEYIFNEYFHDDENGYITENDINDLAFDVGREEFGIYYGEVKDSAYIFLDAKGKIIREGDGLYDLRNTRPHPLTWISTEAHKLYIGNRGDKEMEKQHLEMAANFNIIEKDENLYVSCGQWTVLTIQLYDYVIAFRKGERL